jgi:hypothetical protein
MTKLTPEQTNIEAQAIRNAFIDQPDMVMFSRDYMFGIAALIESLAADAELGRAAVEDHTEWANMMCPSNGKFKMRDDECCEYEDKDCGCQWYNTCRASAGKGGV